MKRPILFVLLSAGAFAGASCTEKNCDSKASSIEACYDCVGIEDKGSTINTPCKEFDFAQGKTCRCKPF